MLMLFNIDRLLIFRIFLLKKNATGIKNNAASLLSAFMVAFVSIDQVNEITMSK